jgi:hypothetical protein
MVGIRAHSHMVFLLGCKDKLLVVSLLAITRTWIDDCY